ncbi:MAG: hypothetical protein M0036_25185 [Desulfobacteraceae bacterium]|nr:hypothetical protein [Desulfobacteraceae bacterium]
MDSRPGQCTDALMQFDGIGEQKNSAIAAKHFELWRDWSIAKKRGEKGRLRRVSSINKIEVMGQHTDLTFADKIHGFESGPQTREQREKGNQVA